MCRRAAHRERPASFVSWKPMRERTADGSFGRQKIPAFRAGRRARTARTTQGRGPTAPAPCVGFAGPSGPQNAAAPRRRPPATPPPPRQRTSAGPPAVAHGKQEGRGGHGGAAAFGGRGAAPGPPPGLPNKKRGPEAKPAPRFSGRFASCRRPPLWVFH